MTGPSSCTPTFCFAREDEAETYVSMEWCFEKYRLGLDAAEGETTLTACISIFDDQISVLHLTLTQPQFIHAMMLHAAAYDYLLQIYKEMKCT